MKCFVSILFVSWGILDGIAQERCFSLDSCIRYALIHRTEIVVSENLGGDVNRAVGYLRQRQLPDMNVSYAHSMNWGRSLNTETYEWEDSRNQNGNASLSSSLTLFAGMRLRNQIRAARINVLRNETTHQKLKNDIELEVIQAFYEVLAADAHRKMTADFYAADEKQEAKMRVLDSAGRMAAPDRLEICGQTRKTGIEKRNAEKAYHLALLRLRKCMNVQEMQAIRFVENGVREEFYIPSVDEIFCSALRHLPEVRALQLDSLLLMNRLKQLRGNFSPQLSLSGMLYTRYQNHRLDPVSGEKYVFWEQLKDNNYKQVGISLSVPLFNRGTVRWEIRELRTEMQNHSLTQNQLLADIRTEVEQIYLEAEARGQNYRLLCEQEKTYREILSLRRLQYEQGKLSVYDLLTAETNWRNVQTELLVERYNLFCYLKMIDFYRTGGVGVVY